MSKKKNENQAQEPAENQTAAPETEQAAEAAPETSPNTVNPLEEQLKAEQDKYLRLAAEYDNFRKRSAREREAIFSDVRCDTVLKFLPVYDNLARALQQETADEAYRKGVEMTMTQLKGILEKLGVTEIEALGKTFDPAIHNAVMHVDDDKYGEGEIILEFERGFRMGDKVIRFSMVQVAN
ncbi:MAG: nucleotide exchange factor GrpE [Candidatus Heteroscillospira sp.]|jgi:molecular chaperone GrpE